MQTVYDWVTVLIFAFLVTVFLSRAVRPDAEDDNLWPYLFASGLCALANWLGNGGDDLKAVMTIGAALVVTAYILGLFTSRRNH